MTYLSELTLWEAETRNDFQMSFKEKLEVARQLDRLNVDCIETGEIKNPKTDALLLKTIGAELKNSVLAVPAGLSFAEIDSVLKALATVKKKRLQLRVPVSSVQMEYVSHQKPKQVLAMIAELVFYAKEEIGDVEFIAEDATRSERSFLADAVETAINAGANVITLCDTAGVMLPDEFAGFIKALLEDVPELSGVTLGVQCSNALNMAAACALAVIRAGAGLIKTTVSGNSTPSLEAVANVIQTRGDSLNIQTRISYTALNRTIQQIRGMTHAMHIETATAKDKSAPESLPVTALDRNTDIASLSKAVKSLGYDLTDEDMARVYEAFVRVAKRKTIELKELDAIVANIALQVPPTYRLVSYVVNSGNIITTTAHVVLDKHGETLTGLGVGDGPIDAALHTIESILGYHYDMEDFQIQALTAGHEAMGQTLIKLRHDGKLYSGRGISTDIISASIRAYINALNKIVYRENGI